MTPIVIVSGGTKGIGKATIERFMEAGFDVVTCARREADLIQLQHPKITNVSRTVMTKWQVLAL